jgi:hypothetical protein
VVAWTFVEAIGFVVSVDTPASVPFLVVLVATTAVVEATGFVVSVEIVVRVVSFIDAVTEGRREGL